MAMLIYKRLRSTEDHPIAITKWELLPKPPFFPYKEWWEGDCICGYLGSGMGEQEVWTPQLFSKSSTAFLAEKGNWKVEADKHSTLAHFWLPHIRNKM